MFLRAPDSSFTLGNFMRTHLYSAMAALKVGADLLFENEKVEIDELYGHGGYYIYPGVGQKITAAALGTPVSVMKTAGEGGPYGMALLASYRINKGTMTLPEFLSEKVFKGAECVCVEPDEETVAGFKAYTQRYVRGLGCQKAATELI